MLNISSLFSYGCQGQRENASPSPESGGRAANSNARLDSPHASSIRSRSPQEKSIQRKLLEAFSLITGFVPSKLPSSEQIVDFMRTPDLKEANPLKALPPDQFVKLPLTAIDGAIVWLNWDLLEEIAPETRLNDRILTPELQRSILERYCKIVDKTKSLEEADEIGYADTYFVNSGDGSEGSGRACHFETGENSKGIGETGLAPKGVSRLDGCAGFEGAVLEAVFGEVCAHLLDNQTTRVLAIIAPNKEWYAHPDREDHPLLIIRVGNHVRPAHFLSRKDGAISVEKEKLMNAAEKMFGETDSTAINKKLTKGHARIEAKKNHRWRLHHGSPNISNTGLGGSMLDGGTFSAQPRTAPIFNMDRINLIIGAMKDIEYANAHMFGAEHKSHWLFTLNLLSEEENQSWTDEYREAKNIETLSALGLPEELSSQIVQQYPEYAHALAKHMRFLGRLFYKNMSADARENWDEAVNSSFADVHALMEKLPAMFFDPESGAAKNVSAEEIHDALDIIDPSYDALPDYEKYERWREQAPLDKYAIENKDEGIARIAESIKVIQAFYPWVMGKAAGLGAQQGRWKDFNEFLRCISARAKFENAPLDVLYSPVIRGKIKAAIERYEEANYENEKYDIAKEILFKEVAGIIEEAISKTKRRVDALLYNSPAQKGNEPDSYILQMQKIDGILYYVEAKKNGERNICMEVPCHLLSDEQRQAIQQEAGVSSDVEEKVLLFKQPAASYQYGQAISEIEVGGETLKLGKGQRQYTYAIPSDSELDEILARKGLSSAE